jgi:hypothetical protein
LAKQALQPDAAALRTGQRRSGARNGQWLALRGSTGKTRPYTIVRAAGDGDRDA